MNEENLNLKDENKLMEQDLFTDDEFIYYKKIKVKNKIDSNIVTEYEFGLKEISGFEEDTIGKKAMKFDAKSGEMKVKQEEANISYLQALLVKAPFPITYDNIKKLSKKIRDELLEFGREINELSDETEKK